MISHFILNDIYLDSILYLLNIGSALPSLIWVRCIFLTNIQMLVEDRVWDACQYKRAYHLRVFITSILLQTIKLCNINLLYISSWHSQSFYYVQSRIYYDYLAVCLSLSLSLLLSSLALHSPSLSQGLSTQHDVHIVYLTVISY